MPGPIEPLSGKHENKVVLGQSITAGINLHFGCSPPTVEAAFGKGRLSATFNLLVVEAVGFCDGTPTPNR
jgi:hypothetical protein